MGRFNVYFTVLIVSLFLRHINSLFVKNEDVSQFIKEINSIQSDWKAEENALTDLDSSEVKRLLGVKEKPEGEDSFEYIKYDIEVPDDIPESFDSRTQWPHCESIASVKDQSNCASCWAVSAAAVMSDRLCITSQTAVNLSAEALMTCCEPCIGGDPEGGCDGGFLDEAWKYWILHGLVTGGDYGSNEGCQPYGIKPCKDCTYQAQTPACVDDKCTNEKYQNPYSDDIHKGKSFYKIPKNMTLIQADILKNGPLQAGFRVYDDLMSYKTGIYRHVKGDDEGKHAVRIIGWGVDSAHNTPYWLVANSWGRWWGEDGLFRILRGTNECEFEQHVHAGTP